LRRRVQFINSQQLAPQKWQYFYHSFGERAVQAAAQMLCSSVWGRGEEVARPLFRGKNK